MNDYTGTDNLEIMAAAIKYNNYLTNLILTNARSGDKILDIGAGIGTFAKRLHDKGHNISCFEPDQLQSEVIESNGLLVARSMDEIETDSLDFMYSFNVLEHIEDDVSALKQWLTLLKPGGKMLIYVPAFQFLYSSMDEKVGHFRRYKKSELIQKSKLAGFNVVSAEYVDSLGFFASVVYKYLNSGSGDINSSALVFYDRFIFPISRVLDSLFNSMLGKNVFLIVERKELNVE
jgi:SAM-dependent methyltransferase